MTVIATPHARSARRAAVLVPVTALIALHVLWQAWAVGAAQYPANYDYDEGVYAETAAAVSAGHRLYAAVFLSQPPLFIGVLGHLFDLFGRSLETARGVVVGFSALWLAALAAAAVRTGGRRSAVWTVAIAASAPVFATAAHTVQMEAPSEALAASAFALALAAGTVAGPKGTSGGTGAWLWAGTGAAAGLAVMTKLTATTCLVPILAIALMGSGARALGRAAPRVAALVAGGAVAAGAVIVWTGSPPQGMWHQAVEFHGAVALVNLIDPARSTSLLLGFGRANWLLALLGLTGLAYAGTAWRTGRRGPRDNAIGAAIAAWLAADLATLFFLRPLWPHNLVILVAPLALLGGAAVEAWRRAAASKAGAVLLIAAWLAALAGTAVATTPETSAALGAAAVETAQLVPAGGWVVADDPIVPFLAGREMPPYLCDTSETRMQAGWLTAAELSSATGDPRVRGVVLWRGTFREMVPEFVAGALRDFPRRRPWDGGRGILGR
ncbi:MAG TPA: glycosyltransferase family 39 protein [bacterium]|nr:glycosyltransferase family 39 protein [bacterium]